MKAHFLFLTVVWSFLGSALVLFGPVSFDTGLFLFGEAFILSLGFLWVPQKYWWYIGSIFLGMTLALLTMQNHQKKWQALPEEYELKSAPVEVVRYPLEKSFYREVVLSQRECQDVCQNILWKMSLEEEIKVGESFFFSCHLEKIQNFSQDFDYQKYLEKEGIGFQCTDGQRGDSIPKTVLGYGYEVLQGGRNFTEKALTRALPEPELGLAKGLILGGSSYLSESLEENFKRVGMTHIVAVSGYNILLVAGFLLLLALLLGFWRRWALVGAFLGVVVFILFVGAPASAVRAGSMAGLSFLALLGGRRSIGFVVLAGSAFLMLLVNPLLLFYDIGFELSFLALVGILFALPEEGTHDGLIQKIGEVVKTTLWVEAFILPLIVYYFGVLSWFSLVANIILIPFVPLAMLGSALLVVIGFWMPTALLMVFSMPVYGVLFGIISFVEYFGSMPGIALEHLSLPGEFLIAWYCILVTLGVIQLKDSKKKWYAKAFLVNGRSHSSRTDIFWK